MKTELLLKISCLKVQGVEFRMEAAWFGPDLCQILAAEAQKV